MIKVNLCDFFFLVYQNPNKTGVVWKDNQHCNSMNGKQKKANSKWEFSNEEDAALKEA